MKIKHSDFQTPNPSTMSKGTTPMLTKNPLTDIQNILHTPISIPESKQTQSPPKKQQQQAVNPLKRRISDTITFAEAQPTKIIRESNSQDIKKTNDKPQDDKPQQQKEEEKEKENKPKEKTTEERVQEEITYLMKTVKCLPNYYKLMDRIGEGTFSTVYKALDIRRDLYNNTNWECKLTTNSTESKALTQYVALKRIYATSSPTRIANEISILEDLKSGTCVAPLITAFRESDQVFIVMPYIPHDDFRKTYQSMDLTDIRYYFKSLFTALRHLHKLKILHRDIKPNNFLYNIKKRTGHLIDFGLAQREDETRPPEPPLLLASKNTNKPLQNTFSQSRVTFSNKENTGVFTSEGKSAGYLRNDTRKMIRANRAGTKGFRAPEILLRVVHQTVAIDIWSVGVILLSFLTGRYPFFIANDEADALIELGTLFGMDAMKRCASRHNRTFDTNVISIPSKPISFVKLCDVLNKDMGKTGDKEQESKDKWDRSEFLMAIDLLQKCLDLDCSTRITAEQALEHPFLASHE
ncbi:kinase-like protein [Backusella circina FSU 941]|nr:kinase-like protein [Backusella circina FSU 941]